MSNVSFEADGFLQAAMDAGTRHAVALGYWLEAGVLTVRICSVDDEWGTFSSNTNCCCYVFYSSILFSMVPHKMRNKNKRHSR